MVLGTACGDDDGGDDDGDDQQMVLPDGSTPDEDGGPGPNIDGGGGDIDGGPDGGPVNPGDSGAGGSITASAQSISFGLSPCGSNTAPAPKTITFTNNGTAAVTWSASLSSTSAFSLSTSGGSDAGAGALSGTLAVGASQTFTVSAAPVNASAIAGQNINATLNVTTNLAAPYTTVSVPVSITPQGAHLQVTPSGGADWALVATGTDDDPLPVTIQNTGNLAAVVAIQQPAITAFSLRASSDLGSPLVTSANIAALSGTTPGSVTFGARFAPEINGAYASSAGLTVSGPVCNGGSNASATTIPFRGAAGGLGIGAVATTPLAEFVNCGATAEDLPSAVIRVRNNTDAAVTVDVSLANLGTSPFTLNESELDLPAGGSGTVIASLKMSEVPNTAVPGTPRSDTVNIIPRTPGLNQAPIALVTRVRGAILQIGSVGPFNGATAITPQSLPVTITNTGNAPASPTVVVGGSHASNFSAAAPNPSPVAGPGTSDALITFTPPVGDSSTKTAQLTLTPAPEDTICGTINGPVTVNGTATTPGLVMTEPASGPLKFGDNGYVDCPTTVPAPAMLTAASPKQVKFRNNGSVALDWAASVDNTTRYGISPTSGSLAPNAEQVITITPTAIDFASVVITEGAYNGVLTITPMNIPGASPTTVTLQQTARGASLQAYGIDADFGTYNVNTAGSGLAKDIFLLTNSGNAPAAVTLTHVPTAYAGTAQYTINGVAVPVMGGVMQTDSFSLNAGATKTIGGVFDPSTGAMPIAGDALPSLVTTTVGTSVVPPLTPLCAPLPTAISVKGTGTNSLENFSVPTAPATWTLPNMRCGVPNTPRTVIVQNSGNLPLEITNLELVNGTSPSDANGIWFSAFIGSLANRTATVPPKAPDGTNGTVAITVTPRTITMTEWSAAGGVNPGTPTIRFNTRLNISANTAGMPRNQTIILTEDVDCPP